MAKRDPELTARNKRISSLSEQLDDLLPEVLRVTGYKNIHSLHGKIGGKNSDFINIRDEVIYSAEHFISLYLQGYGTYLESLGDKKDNSYYYENYLLLCEHEVFQDYLYIFLERTYLRNYESLTRKRPKIEESEIWIGQQNANYGILITPRFGRNGWENDKSEIRHFPQIYWTIGHVLETGLVVPNNNTIVKFYDVDQYLTFFRDIIVRNSGSKHEYEIAKLYCEYVKQSSSPENIPLLIPEFRYNGIAKDHTYRLDYCIIDPYDMNKIGFELSPWSTHGYLSKIKGLTQKEINDMAQDNFEKEMKKHKDYFRKHGVFVLIYTDDDLKDYNLIFKDMEKYISPKTIDTQLKFHIIDDFFSPKYRI